MLGNFVFKSTALRGLNSFMKASADSSVTKLRSTSEGVPIMSKIDSKMWPSVALNSSGSDVLFYLGERGKH